MDKKPKTRIKNAKEKGWTYIHANKIGLIVGVPPPPADNFEFHEIPKIKKSRGNNE